ncbi:hypothetical protein HK101_010040 [Irineochytrium annulatum]|nr:hypothetical protein HK101_010040 [Irineochytrium annulatum]
MYEKRLILKYIADNGKEPGTGEELTEDDIVVVKSASKVVKPRPPTMNSVPALLSLLQNEWDSVMLETYQLKQQYATLRQELSNALYENDAAKRVIARLAKERDQARENLATVTAAQAVSGMVGAPAGGAGEAEAGNNATAMDVDEGEKAEMALPAEICEVLDSTHDSLSKARKKRKPGPDNATVEQIKHMTEKKSVDSLYQAKTGVTAFDLHAASNHVATAGNDGSFSVHDLAPAQPSQEFSVKAHTKKVSAVAWVDEDMVLTGSVDKTVKVWNVKSEEKKPKAKATYKHHDGEIVGLSVNPSKKYFATASTDATWSFADISAGKHVLHVRNPEVTKGYSSISFHPDGQILGTGTSDGHIRIWEVKSAQNVASFTNEHDGKPVTCLSFSENGYYLASCSEDMGIVRLWDLRKLTNFHSIDLKGQGVEGIQKVRFDYSGQYLGAAAGDHVRIFMNKTWEPLSKYAPIEGSTITDFKFGQNAKTLVAAADRKVVVLGA